MDSEAESAAQEEQAALVRGLRVYFRRHNVQALALALISLGTSVTLWALIYVAVYWFSLVGATLSRSFNPETLLEINQPDLVGRAFPLYFAGGAVLSLVVAGVARKYLHPERLREARYYALWIAAELLLAVPNTTFAVWGNFAAITRLRRRDAVAAAELLQRIRQTEGGLSLATLPVELEDASRLQRVLFALQLVGLVGLREKERGWFLCLEKQEELALLSRPADVAAAG